MKHIHDYKGFLNESGFHEPVNTVTETAKRTKFTGKTAHDLYTQLDGKPKWVFVKNDWYQVNPAELKDGKGDSFIGYTKDGSDYEFYLKDIKFIQESVVNESRSISKIQYDWSKLTTSMQATAQNWKAAEGAAKESLLGKLKEMTAQKKALEAELDDAIADKDKDLELVVTESFFRMSKDIDAELVEENLDVNIVAKTWDKLYGEDLKDEYYDIWKKLKAKGTFTLSDLKTMWYKSYGGTFKDEYDGLYKELKKL